MSSVASVLIQKGIEEGIQKGIQQGIKDTAKKLLNENVPISIIMKCTGLTEEEIIEN